MCMCEIFNFISFDCEKKRNKTLVADMEGRQKEYVPSIYDDWSAKLNL